MLKCVVFLVTAYGYELLFKEQEKIEAQLAGGKLPFEIRRSDDFMGCTEYIECTEWIEYTKEDLLFITDDAKMLQQLLAGDYYGIAFYHEKNRDVFFEGAVYAVEDISQLSRRSYEEAYRRLARLPWDILETGRLKVRESTVEDVEAFYRIYADPSITCYMEDLFQDPDEERAYMETYIRQFYGFYGFGMWTVIYKETGQIIGRAGLSIREGYDLPELGFVIDVAFQKRGLAFEVCSEILRYAKAELLFDTVQALAEPENAASLRLLARLGFVFERIVVENGKTYHLLIKEQNENGI